MDYKKILNDCFSKDQEAIATKNQELIEKRFRKNTEELKKLISEFGFLKLIEEERYLNKVWLIAQHSDHDPDFQLQCLGLMLPFLGKKKDLLMYCTFLIDRLLIGRKANQIYGTQLDGKIEKPDTFSHIDLNKLRENVGLEPIEKYIKKMEEYSKKTS
jgi:hypothetical protein